MSAISDLHPAGFFLLCAANIALAILVFFHDRHATVNKLFALAVFTIVGWITSISLSLGASDINQTILLGRLAFAFASAMPFALLRMFEAFPPSLPTHRKTLIIPGFFCVIFIFFSLSPWIVAGAMSRPPRPNFVYGRLYPFFAVYIVLCFALALVTLSRKIRAASGFKRLQLRYLLLGILIGGAGALTTNLFIPVIWKTSRYSVLGPYFSLLMVSFSAHAIIRYRLMNIRLVIRRGVVYLLAVTAAALVFLALLGLITSVPFFHPRGLPLWMELAVVLLIALLFHPLRHWIQTSLDRYLYRESYDYQRTIREASRTIGSTLDLQSLLNYLCEVIGRTVRPEMVSIYIRDPRTSAYTRMGMQRFIDANIGQEQKIILSEGSSLLEALRHTRAFLLRDDAERTNPHPHRTRALKELADLGGELALPILHEDQLSGFLMVAPKLSGDPYFSEDIDLLSTLVGQGAIAIKNAQLYREVALVNEYVTNIVATMESGVVAVDTNETVTLFNPAAERIIGVPTGVIRSSPLNHLPAIVAHPLKATLEDGQPRVLAETTVSDGTGRHTPVSYSTHALRDHLGNVFGAVGVFSDLTRLKQLEGEKRRAERLASIGALASGIAHEIKNPLVAIKTFAELLPERFPEQDFREDFSQVVIREISRIDDLVAKLRGLAAPAARPLPSLDLRAPIEETLDLLRGQLEQKRIRVRRLYEQVPPRVAGDSAQLKQLFLNLFINALEAMSPGGELTIRLVRRDGPGAPSLLVEVTDTGTGIREEILGKIFDPFVTTKPRGSGLGLAICRGIADAHGATIRAENKPDGRGSTLAVEFPGVAAVITSATA